MPYISVTKGNYVRDLFISQIVTIGIWSGDSCIISATDGLEYIFEGTKEALYDEISRAIYRQNFDKGFRDLVDS